MPEDYSRSKTLATVEHLGETFRIVRRRFDGKPWRKYLMVLHDGVPITNEYPWEAIDPKECACEVKALLSRLITTQEVMMKGLARVHGGGGYA
jgi:hypothetical protein